MKLVHDPEHYVEAPKPEYEMEIKGNGFFIGTSTRLRGTMREREPDPYARRMYSGFVGIDFEGEDISKWVDDLMFSIGRPWPTPKRDLALEGHMYYGVFPVENERDNVWKCSFDMYKEIMNHKQHYRYRDFSMFVRRSEYTDYGSFKMLLGDPNVKHVIVDCLTHQCLADTFEEFQDEARIAGPAEKELGLILTIGDRLVFADTYLPRERHWVNVNPGSPSARPQFIVVQPQSIKPWPVPVEQ
jgi:hypothetical protein